jgi:hypothetical protein
MKRGTPEHPKTEMLAMILGIEIAHAVGLLEMLWHFAGRYAPAGDIGRWPDEMIAKRSGWNGDSKAFIDALLKAKGTGKYGWLEKVAKHGLVIHDWHEHADETVKKWLENHDENFWNGHPPRSRTSRETTANNSRTFRRARPEPEPEPEPSQSPARAGTPAGVFKHVTKEMLSAPPHLASWFRDASQRKRPILPDSEQNLLRVFSAAERALEVGSNPPALFASIVSKGDWHLITQAQEERATAKIKSLQSDPYRRPSGFAPTVKRPPSDSDE